MSGIRISQNDALLEASETGIARIKVGGSDVATFASTIAATLLGASISAGTTAPGGTPAEGDIYFRRLGSAGTGDILVGANGAWVSTVAGASGFVPTSRTFTTTAPLTIDGGTSADLSANRTLAISNATTGAVGVVRLTQDLGGSGASPTVLGLTGTSNVVAMHGTTIQWDTAVVLTIKGADYTTNSSTAPLFTMQAPNATGTSGTGGSLVIQSGTGTSTAGNVTIQTGAGTAGQGNVTAQISGSSFIQIVSGQIQIKHASSVIFDADSFIVRSSGSSSKGFWDNTGLRIGDGTAPGVKLNVGIDSDTTNVNIRVNGKTATSANTGANGAPPAQVVGYLSMNIKGTEQKIPYYAV